ncbi:hypothetical protein [Photobacterium sanguinicancri]|uniref:hypothetical protein n=1 Tax=Photobacterium sanguinicancri TaxID=875932 RepID=UPI003D12411F
MTNHERKRLIEAYTEYVSGRFNELTSLVVLVVGFCLGTLSASSIPPIVNIVIMVIVLITFKVLMTREKGGPNSKLKAVIDELEVKYGNKANHEETMEEIRSYDIWKGFSSRVVKHNLPLLFGVLFCIYTLIEHILKIFPLGNG